MVVLCLDTGIRLGELANLRWTAVWPDSIRVTGKTGPRIVPVSRGARDMLTGLGDSDHIWVSRKGPMSLWAVQMVIRRLFIRAGLQGPKSGPHTLRHTFGTHYIANGGSLAHLQRIMGHVSIETTMIYVHLSADMLGPDHAEHSPARRLLNGS